ncbi:MAG: type II toxin-antitoxin system toxin DNA ADP-ribosyl transferase DarT [Pseudomonadota bacterium]
MSDALNPDKALIFRIVHRDNVPWLLRNGLHCRHAAVQDPGYRTIGNPDLIDKRQHRQVPIAPHGTLSDYVPFYFTPYTPMLLNIKTGYGGMTQVANDEIVILVSGLHKLQDLGHPFVFTDRHAYLIGANFYRDLADLTQIDWGILQRRDFKRDPEDPGKIERYQAEALVYQQVPIEALLGIVCYTDAVKSALEQEVADCGLNLQLITRPGWYF